jgi:hypothetical protein
VVVYDDKECNLKAAHKRFKAEDIEGALASAQAQATACKDTPGVKEKTLGHAYYNLGLAQFLSKDFQAASASLSEAAKYQGGEIVKNLRDESRAAEQRANVVQSGSAPPTNRPPSRPPQGQPAPEKTASVEERLKQIENLRAKGLMTKEEYEKKRAQIIDGI